MGDVVGIGGSTVLPIPPDKVLDGAKVCDEVVVIGWHGNDFYMATSQPDLKDVLLLVEIAKRGIMDRIVE